MPKHTRSLFLQFEKGDLKDLQVTGEDLIESKVVKQLRKSTAFIISDVEFEPGPLGAREICVAWKDLEDYVRVQVCLS